MIKISPLKENRDGNNRKSIIQTIILKKNTGNRTTINNNTNSINGNNTEISDKSFKVSELSYFNVKKKCRINFSQGKIYVKLGRDKNNFIHFIFYDSSLRLRFQGLINTKKSSLNIDINNNNCVIINEIIGLIYYSDENGNSKYDMIVTNAYIHFLNKTDINNFLNCLC